MSSTLRRRSLSTSSSSSSDSCGSGSSRSSNTTNDDDELPAAAAAASNIESQLSFSSYTHTNALASTTAARNSKGKPVQVRRIRIQEDEPKQKQQLLGRRSSSSSSSSLKGKKRRPGNPIAAPFSSLYASHDGTTTTTASSSVRLASAKPKHLQQQPKKTTTSISRNGGGGKTATTTPTTKLQKPTKQPPPSFVPADNNNNNNTVLNKKKKTQQQPQQHQRPPRPTAAEKKKNRILPSLLMTKYYENGDNQDPHFDDSDDDSSMSDMEVPYTQNLGLHGEDFTHLPKFYDDYDDDDGDDDENKIIRKEPLRPGDIIVYTHPLFVAGSRAGWRMTSVLNTDPNREFCLTLDNGELLPSDTQVRRCKEYRKGKLLHHRGIFRPVENFNMRKAALSAKQSDDLAGFRVQVQRLGNIMDSFKSDMEMAPQRIREQQREKHNKKKTAGNGDEKKATGDSDGDDEDSSSSEDEGEVPFRSKQQVAVKQKSSPQHHYHSDESSTFSSCLKDITNQQQQADASATTTKPKSSASSLLSFEIARTTRRDATTATMKAHFRADGLSSSDEAESDGMDIPGSRAVVHQASKPAASENSTFPKLYKKTIQQHLNEDDQENKDVPAVMLPLFTKRNSKPSQQTQQKRLSSATRDDSKARSSTGSVDSSSRRSSSNHFSRGGGEEPSSPCGGGPQTIASSSSAPSLLIKPTASTTTGKGQRKRARQEQVHVENLCSGDGDDKTVWSKISTASRKHQRTSTESLLLLQAGTNCSSSKLHHTAAHPPARRQTRDETTGRGRDESVCSKTSSVSRKHRRTSTESLLQLQAGTNCSASTLYHSEAGPPARLQTRDKTTGWGQNRAQQQVEVDLCGRSDDSVDDNDESLPPSSGMGLVGRPHTVRWYTTGRNSSSQEGQSLPPRTAEKNILSHLASPRTGKSTSSSSLGGPKAKSCAKDDLFDYSSEEDRSTPVVPFPARLSSPEQVAVKDKSSRLRKKKKRNHDRAEKVKTKQSTDSTKSQLQPKYQSVFRPNVLECVDYGTVDSSDGDENEVRQFLKPPPPPRRRGDHSSVSSIYTSSQNSPSAAGPTTSTKAASKDRLFRTSATKVAPPSTMQLSIRRVPRSINEFDF